MSSWLVMWIRDVPSLPEGNGLDVGRVKGERVGKHTLESTKSAHAWLPPLGRPKTEVVMVTEESRSCLSKMASIVAIAAPVSCKGV